MNKQKIERCKFSFPDIRKEEGEMKLRYFCQKGVKEGMGKEVECSDCVKCENFKSRYIEYPITVSGIECREIKYNDSSRIGSFVKVRPCGEEYKGKTYLGVLLGDLPTSPYITHNSETNMLTVGSMTNPAIYVFELKKIVFGYESWWGIIKNEDDMKEIKDEDIENTWYVKLAKEIMEENKK